MYRVIVQEVSLPSKISVEIAVDYLVQSLLVKLNMLLCNSFHEVAPFFSQPKIFHLIVEVFTAELNQLPLQLQLNLHHVIVIDNFVHRNQHPYMDIYHFIQLWLSEVIFFSTNSVEVFLVRYKWTTLLIGVV